MEYLAPTGYNWKNLYSSADDLRDDIPAMSTMECNPGWYNHVNDYMLILPCGTNGSLMVYVYSFDPRTDAQNALSLPQHFETKNHPGLNDV